MPFFQNKTRVFTFLRRSEKLPILKTLTQFFGRFGNLSSSEERCASKNHCVGCCLHEFWSFRVRDRSKFASKGMVFGEEHIARSLWETTTFLVGDYEIRLFGTLLDSFVKLLSHFFGGFKLSENN